MGHAPWNWVVGTGIYLDDVDVAFSAAAWRFALIALGVTLAAMGLVTLLARNIAVPIIALVDVAQRLAQRDFSVDVDRTPRTDEIGTLTMAVGVLRDEAAQLEAVRAEQQDSYKAASNQRRIARLKLADDVEATI